MTTRFTSKDIDQFEPFTPYTHILALQLGAAPGIPNRAVTTMTALEAEVGDMSIEEVANYEGTFEDAVSEEVIPPPELMQFNDGQIWRKK